jgi:glycosyltransferase involved in cell wall biosynthesis
VRSADPLAILPAYNEADVIGAVLEDLIAQGCQVHILDNLSTDGTAEIVRSLLGRGVVAIEDFPSAGYQWAAMLRRVEEIAHEHVGRWIILANADEFRESPWPGLTLAEAIGRVDAMGYNAIDHELFNFRPVDDSFVPGTDPRLHMRHYEPVDLPDPDSVQLKTWKQGYARVDLASTGGHLVAFPGRRVCPVKFTLRHYPIRGETHGRRKVFAERFPRFDPAERARGWHVQYDGYASGGARFLHDPVTLQVWGDDHVRR